ncbi:MAG: class I SAM-dependent methyltransferase [Planctomycetes bacterium]|nr:class I SAM-dependent methyltransferase [Planctomycetota bacterium]
MDPRVLEKYKSPAGAASYNVKYEEEWIKRLSKRREFRVIERVFSIVGPQKRLLDLPSGTGRLFLALRPFGREFFETDVSREMLKLARVNLAEFKPHVAQASAFHIPYRDASFDCVFSARLAHHIPNSEERDRYIRELGRVSRGWVVMTFFHTWSLKNILRRVRRLWNRKRPKITMSPGELREVAKTVGLELVTTIPLARLFSGHHYAIFRKVKEASS